MHINQIIYVVSFLSFGLENSGECGTLTAKETKYQEMHTVFYPYSGFKELDFPCFLHPYFLFLLTVSFLLRVFT